MSFRDKFCLKKIKQKCIPLKVFLDVQQCCCSEFVHCAALGVVCGFVVGTFFVVYFNFLPFHLLCAP